MMKSFPPETHSIWCLHFHGSGWHQKPGLFPGLLLLLNSLCCVILLCIYIHMQKYMFNLNQQRQIQKPRYTSIDHSRLFEKFQLDWIIYNHVRLTESDLIVQILIMSSSLIPICVVSPKTWKGKMSWLTLLRCWSHSYLQSLLHLHRPEDVHSELDWSDEL